MNAAHIHLVLNHFPIVGSVLSVSLLLYALLYRGGEGPKRALRRVAYLMIVLVAAATVPTYFSGQRAENMVEDLQGVSKTAIEPHEERAEIGFIAIGITGALALIGAILGGGRLSPPAERWLALGIAAALLISTLILISAANLGGKIHHPEIEIRAGAASGPLTGERVV